MQNFLSLPVAFIADIANFYQKFYLESDQLHISQILWSEDLNPDTEPEIYYMVVLMFGINCVSKLCILGLQLLVELYPQFERILLSLTYVDDAQVSAMTREKAIKERDDLVEKLQAHNLTFKKWLICGEDTGETNYLGLIYHSEDDTWSPKVGKILEHSPKKGNIENIRQFLGTTTEELVDFLGDLTTRRALALAMSQYDSNGMLSCILARIRSSLREAHQLSEGEFDRILPQDFTWRFCQLLMEYQKVGSLRYPRTLHEEDPPEEDFEITSFSDFGYEAKCHIQYTRLKRGDSNYSVSFLSARTQLSKVAEDTPKGELDSMKLASLAVDAQRRNLRPYSNKDPIHFCDSTIALCWLANPMKSLQVFQRNRVSHIVKSFTDKNGIMNVYHIKSELNISDLGSKGKAEISDIDPDSTWFRAPDFLRKNLSEAEERGDITRLDRLTLKLGGKEKLEFQDGILYKNMTLSKEAERLQSVVKELEIENATPTLAMTEAVSAMKKCYIEGKYLINPLRVSFPKLITAISCSFRFILILVKKCLAKYKRATYAQILEKYSQKSDNNIAFSMYNIPTINEIQQEERTERIIQEAERASFTIKETRPLFVKMRAQDLVKQTQKDLLVLNSEEEQPNKDHLLHQVAVATSEMKNMADDFKKNGGIISNAQSFLATGRQSDRQGIDRKDISTWLRYPGMLHNYRSIRKLERLISDGIASRSQLQRLEVLSMISNTFKYLKAYSRQEFTKEVAGVLMNEFYEAISKLTDEDRESLKEAGQEAIKDTSSFLNNDTPDAIAEMIEWLLVADLHLPAVPASYEANRGVRVLPYVNRYLLSKIYTSQAEYSWLTLLTWDHFHAIFTREIRGTWSKSRIERYCNETGDKLTSNYRFRLGVEVAQLTAKELTDSGYQLNSTFPEFNSLIPIASKHSVLIFSLLLHIHSNRSLNPLKRVKLPNHRGIHFDNIQLLRIVHCPGVLQKISLIKQSCPMCQVRLKKSYKAALAPLPEATFTLNPGFLVVAMDFKGPYTVKLLKQTSETRYWKHAKCYILVVACLTTRAVCLELCEDETAESIADAITRVACQYGVPRIIHCDRAASNINFLQNSEIVTKTNEILIRERGVSFQLTPVGKHHALGRAERRCRSVGDLLGALDLTQHPQSSIQLITTLMMIAELINSTPLGATLNTSSEPLQVLTPNHLLNRVKSRALTKPISVPPNISAMMRRNQESWQEIVKLYNTTVLPAMLMTNLWHHDVNQQLKIDDVVMFRKETSEPRHAHLTGWVIGRVSRLEHSKDNKPRRVEVTYTNKEDKNPTHMTTVRDSNVLYPLFPMTA